MTEMRILRLTLFAVAITLLLGGCGQRGPLYLPDEQHEEE